MPTKIRVVRDMVFPVVTYRCESWSIKKAEPWRIDAFLLWCWGRLLRVPWTANQLILKEINPEYSLEGLVLQLKLQYFRHLIWKAYSSLEKTLMLGKIEGKKRRGRQRLRWLDGIPNSMDMNFSTFWEIEEDRGAWHAVVHGVTKSQTGLKSVNNNNNPSIIRVLMQRWNWTDRNTGRRCVNMKAVIRVMLLQAKRHQRCQQPTCC